MPFCDSFDLKLFIQQKVKVPITTQFTPLNMWILWSIDNIVSATLSAIPIHILSYFTALKCFKVLKLEHLSRYLSITVFMLLTVIEFIRLYLGHYGNLSCRVPELAGFLMLTVLMQMPLVSFFLFNPYLLSTPTEFVLHASLWLTTVAEIVYCFLALKEASSVAKSVYMSHSRDLGRLK